LGCPIVGDSIYGRRHSSIKIGRQFLHAFRLKIVLVEEQKSRTFEAPLPEDLKLALDQVRKDLVSAQPGRK
jgi:23S rRNA pseudouridine1911/1915/1917 synthase